MSPRDSADGVRFVAAARKLVADGSPGLLRPASRVLAVHDELEALGFVPGGRRKPKEEARP